MEEVKKVSVVMCTYNGEKYIREQLDSILAQTYPIYELIIQDDGSTDNTVAILREYEALNSNIVVSQNQVNVGFNENFKLAIAKAKGDYIAISDQDDIWYPQKIEKQIKAIKDYSICCSAFHRDKFYSEENTQIIIPKYNLEEFLFVNPVPGYTMLIRSDFAKQFKDWNVHFYYDWWFAVYAYFDHGIIRVDEPLNWHRPHSGSAIARIHEKHKGNVVDKPTYHPYIYGYKWYRKLQKKTAWNIFYAEVARLAEGKYPLTHKLACLLRKKDIFSFFYLCVLCMINKNLIYPSNKDLPIKNTFRSYMRAFCYPLIFSYGNTNYEL